MPARYSRLDEFTALGFLVNAMDPMSRLGDGDHGCSFPRSDAEDMSRGARFIPGEVTLARREGRHVKFVSDCGPCCWYWLMPDGARRYHYDPGEHDAIGRANKRVRVQTKNGLLFDGGAGPCPTCKNPNTNGGTVKAMVTR